MSSPSACLFGLRLNRRRESLESANVTNPAFSDQLKALVNTTDGASREIRTFLFEAKASSERLEELMVMANSVQAEQGIALKSVEQNTSKASSILGTLAGTVGSASTQLVKLFSLTEHLEEWIKAIVQYCKDIIALVRQNTHLLLSLHGIMTRLEVVLRQPGINLPILEFENPFGIKMALPFQMCDTWEVCTAMVSELLFTDLPRAYAACSSLCSSTSRVAAL